MVLHVLTKRASFATAPLGTVGHYRGGSMTSQESGVSLFPVFVRQGETADRYRVGYINQTGSCVVPAHFDDGMPFSEGLAAVSNKGRWGYIDVFGTFVIPPLFESDRISARAEHR